MLLRSRIVWIGATICVLVFLAVVLRHREGPGASAPPESGTSLSSAPTGQVTGVSSSRSLTNFFVLLRKAADIQTVRHFLANVHKDLAGMAPKDATALIEELLASKEDAPTRLGFKVGRSGWLAEAPTARVFLLDELGRVNPEAAAAYAKTLLGTMESPDEWAVALRNLARGDTSAQGRSLLAQKTQEVLNCAPWQQNPSVGYLEAFDVAVHLGGTEFVPTLSKLVRGQDNPQVAHAAFLALDRLVINDAGSTLATLQASPELMQGRELTRADYFARSDVRDPQQRQILEQYLLNPNLSAAELQQFVGVFPNANFMVSENLLTPTVTPEPASLASRDAESLRTVERWMADPRFAKLQPQLQRVKQRLESFLKN